MEFMNDSFIFFSLSVFVSGIELVLYFYLKNPVYFLIYFNSLEIVFNILHEKKVQFLFVGLKSEVGNTAACR